MKRTPHFLPMRVILALLSYIPLKEDVGLWGAWGVWGTRRARRARRAIAPIPCYGMDANAAKENHADKSTSVVPIGSKMAFYGQAKISSYHRNCYWRRERQCNRWSLW
jgi:hypothetical protein